MKNKSLLFLLAFGIGVILFYLGYNSDFYQDNLEPPLLNVQATISSGLLNLFGEGTTVSKEVITSPDFAISIKNGCDGMEASALFLIAILVFPLGFKWKIPGIIAGYLTLFIANIARIAGLFLVGKYWSEAFDFMHLHGGLILFSALAIFVWLVWVNWALKKQQLETVSDES